VEVTVSQSDPELLDSMLLSIKFAGEAIDFCQKDSWVEGCGRIGGIRHVDQDQSSFLGDNVPAA
jgi:hypothetical protein